MIESSKSRFVALPNGTVLDAENISFIGQAALNEYSVFFKLPSPMSPKMDRANYEALVDFLKPEKAVMRPGAEEEKPKVVAVAK